MAEIGAQKVRPDNSSAAINVRHKHGADLLFVQLGTDTSDYLEPQPPSWNVYTSAHLSSITKLAKCVLNHPDGVVVVVHSGNMLHATKIFDAFDGEDPIWAMPETITIWNDTPRYVRAGRRMVSEVVDVHVLHCW